MNNIYAKFNRAFSQVEAYAIFSGHRNVARIAFKFSRTGGRVTSYVHFWGSEMLSGTANGGGYDKRSAAAGQASCKLGQHLSVNEVVPEMADAFIAFHTALRRDDGRDFVRHLTDHGFTVAQVI